MRFRLKSAKVGDEDNFWWENYDKPTTNPEQWCKDIIGYFNATCKPGEQQRVYLGFELLAVQVMKVEHNWSKTNLYTITGKGFMHDTQKCNGCGITGKRFGFADDITIDPKYEAKVYQGCVTAQEQLEKLRHKKYYKDNYAEIESTSYSPWDDTFAELPWAWGPDDIISPLTGHRRHVRIEISTWQGTSPGAQHFYAKLEENKNKLVDRENKQLITPHRLPESMKEPYEVRDFSEGSQFDDLEFKDPLKAVQWCAKMYLEHFPRHEIQLNYYLHNSEEVELDFATLIGDAKLAKKIKRMYV